MVGCRAECAGQTCVWAECVELRWPRLLLRRGTVSGWLPKVKYNLHQSC